MYREQCAFQLEKSRDYIHKGSGRCLLCTMDLSSHTVPDKWKLLCTHSLSRETIGFPWYSPPFPVASSLSIANKISSGQKPMSSLVWKSLFYKIVEITQLNQVLSLGSLNYEIRRQSGRSYGSITERSAGRDHEEALVSSDCRCL